MYDYYFKIKKNNVEFEFSTTDRAAFDEKLAEWVGRISNEQVIEEEKSGRQGFIDSRNLVSINEIQTPVFETETSDLNFEETLEQTMQNPKIEVIEKTDTTPELGDEFRNYTERFNPQNQTDYLIITALYILNTENIEHFSLKQINAKLVPLTGNAVDHPAIQECISQNLIEVVPDLTGVNEVTEYKLTKEGEGYFI
jgi:hypothetical protein